MAPTGVFLVRLLLMSRCRQSRKVFRAVQAVCRLQLLGEHLLVPQMHRLEEFFAAALEKVGGCTAGPGSAVLNVYINPEKRFAFVEFRAVAEASNAMALNGTLFRGVELIVRRPNDYNLAAAVALGNHTPAPSLDLEAVGLAPLGGPDNRIFVGGLPPYIDESHCKELLEFFGAVKRFALHSDPISGDSLGFGLAIFKDPSVSDAVCEGLSGIRMGGGELRPPKPGPRGHHSLLALGARKLLLYGGALCTPGCVCYGDTWTFMDIIRVGA